MRKTYSTMLSGFLLLTIPAFFLGYSLNQSARANPNDKIYDQLKIFTWVLSYIEDNYVETVDSQTLIHGALKGMVKSLDPHCSFYTPEEFLKFKDDTRGEFVGIGVELEASERGPRVVSPISGSPAEKAGLKPNDIIVEVNGKDVSKLTVHEVAKLLRGKADTKVDVGVLQGDSKEPNRFQLTRELIHMVAVTGKILEPGYAYVKIRSFQEDISDDFFNIFKALKTQNESPVIGLIVDLRNNPGGLLAEAIKLSDMFIDEGVLVTTEGRNDKMLDEYVARGRKTKIHCPVVVLVNGGTASASEIFAGALQDHKRAVVVGTTTFGKGSVQTILDLDDGSGLKLTIARYYTPNHRSIQNQGIIPNIRVDNILGPTPVKEPRERDLKGRLEGTSKPETKDLAPDHLLNDVQLRIGLDVLQSFNLLTRSE